VYGIAFMLSTVQNILALIGDAAEVITTAVPPIGDLPKAKGIPSKVGAGGGSQAGMSQLQPCKNPEPRVFMIELRAG